MGEYISREAVLKHLNECKEGPFFDPDMARICFAISVFIEDMQAADVQPVKHGQWLKRMSTPDSLKCSVCGNNHEYETTYCPHCGARMDGDAERRCEK